jgi:hypothetical protein
MTNPISFLRKILFRNVLFSPKKVQEEIQTAIKIEFENQRLIPMVAKKNKAPPQPAVLHSHNTAEREDEENSNQPEEDIGNTTPQNEG